MTGLYNDLSAKIKETIVQSISASTITGVKSLRVYEYEPNTMDGFPFISIATADTVAEFADTNRNRRTYSFNIKCYQERKEFGAEKAERVLRQLNDELINVFDAQHYLYGDFLRGRGFVHAMPGAWSYIITDQIDVRVTSILLACEVIQ